MHNIYESYRYSNISVINYFFFNLIFQTSDPYKASIAKVVPTPNNGSTELIKVNRSKNQEPWFIFQKTKYVWDPSKKEFQGLLFPIKYTMDHYSQWKGYADDKEVEEAEEKYGQNK